MTERGDELIDLLRPLDPADIDPPPEPGSTRYHDIEATIMTDIEHPSSAAAPPSSDPPSSS